MTTYTIATTIPTSDDGVCLLLATVPDGDNIDAAAADEIATGGLDEHGPCEYEITTGLVLTDDEPEDDTRVIWSGHSCGLLIDETGRTWEFALRV